MSQTSQHKTRRTRDYLFGSWQRSLLAAEGGIVVSERLTGGTGTGAPNLALSTAAAAAATHSKAPPERDFGCLPFVVVVVFVKRRESDNNGQNKNINNRVRQIWLLSFVCLVHSVE